jgi:hypothetical protein
VAFDDDGLCGHPGGLELLGHVRRVSERHPFILSVMEQQEGGEVRETYTIDDTFL